MLWPINKHGVQLTRVVSDEAGGELLIRAVFDDGVELDIVYEGMFYSQFDENSEGLTIISVAEVSPEELNAPEHAKAAARLFEDCGADNAFLKDMRRRGNHLYVHKTKDSEYIVLAKRRTFGETWACAEA